MGMLAGIKYLFQIPMDWFLRVDRRVFGNHPGPGVKFTEDNDGSIGIGLNYEVLDERYLSAADAEDFVTLDGTQTITGSKTFSSTVYIKPSSSNAYFLIENETAGIRGYFGQGDIWLDKDAGESMIRFRDMARTVLGMIRFNRTDGNLTLQPGSSGHVLLSKKNTDSTSTTALDAVALGYVNDKFVRKPSSDGVLVSGSDGGVSPSKPGTSTDDLVLTYKAGAASPSWEKGAASSAENPTSFVTLGPSTLTSSTADANTWTAGGDNGLKIRLFRTSWNGGTLYGFYRTATFDKYGRLYNVTGETRFTIDTAVSYTP